MTSCGQKTWSVPYYSSVGANGILVGNAGTGSGSMTGVAVPAGNGGAIFVASDSHDQHIGGTAIYVPPEP